MKLPLVKRIFAPRSPLLSLSLHSPIPLSAALKGFGREQPSLSKGMFHRNPLTLPITDGKPTIGSQGPGGWDEKDSIPCPFQELLSLHYPMNTLEYCDQISVIHHEALHLLTTIDNSRPTS
jgi:hypothetical protein